MRVKFSYPQPCPKRPKAPLFCQPRIGEDTLHGNLALSSQSRVRIGHRMAPRHVVKQVAHLQGYILTTEMPYINIYTLPLPCIFIDYI
jgi:hypothetical protein